MKTTQGWGWVAAGVMALGLNGFYHDGGMAFAHQIADRISERSASVVAMASGQAEDLVSRAAIVSARGQDKSCRFGTAVAQLQTQIAQAQTRIADLADARTARGFARLEAISARQEAQMARMEATRARIQVQVPHVQFSTASFHPAAVTMPDLSGICPRVHVVVPRPDVRVNVSSPDIHLTMGDGPI